MTQVSRGGEAQPHCVHYTQQTTVMMKRDDSFYVRPSLMSNGSIITECKQEKTLHTDMGLVLEQVFVVVLKAAGSRASGSVCYLW